MDSHPAAAIRTVLHIHGTATHPLWLQKQRRPSLYITEWHSGFPLPYYRLIRNSCHYFFTTKIDMLLLHLHHPCQISHPRQTSSAICEISAADRGSRDLNHLSWSPSPCTAQMKLQRNCKFSLDVTCQPPTPPPHLKLLLSCTASSICILSKQRPIPKDCWTCCSVTAIKCTLTPSTSTHFTTDSSDPLSELNIAVCN